MGFSLEEFPNSDYYDSDLRKILKYMRKFAETLNSYEEIIQTLSLAIKDIDSMKDAILALQVATSDLNIIRNDIQTLFTDFSTLSIKVDSIEAHIESLSKQINSLKQYVDSSDYLLEKKIEFNRILLQNEIDELRKAILDVDTETLNPWHYELGKVNLGHNFRLAYGDLADSVPTAEEYAGLGLTADEYSEFDLTAIRYCLSGKKELRMYWVYSPCYGWKQEISNVLTSIVNAVFGTLSASDYSALDMTADEYASMDMTSEDYQRYNPTATSGYLRVSPTGNGLTKTQYEHIELV